MTTAWVKEEEVKPVEPHFEQHDGQIRMYIDEHGDERWHSFVLTLGEFVTDSLNDCLANWPRQAIAKARKELDRFEKVLDEREAHETSI